MKPKKLIRNGNYTERFKEHLENITDKDQLNKLYILKIKEELQEIIDSDFKDIYEFVDLLDVCDAFREQNFSREEFGVASRKKLLDRGFFGTLVLTDLNPENPSNKVYFEE